MKNYQIAIIGGGAIGSAIARELSKYQLDVIVFEKGSDVPSGASKANSGVIHSGINSPVDSLKARFCVAGNNMFQSLSSDLGFPLKWAGKFVIAKEEDEIKELENLKSIGMKNGVQGIEILDGSAVTKREPHVACTAGLWVPSAGITLPYQFTIALAENAVENGVNFLLETPVTGLKKQSNQFLIQTPRGGFQSNIVVNATGVNCREIVAMVEEPDFQVYPCRGEYLVLDKNYSSLVTSMIYPVPVKELGVLGVHVTPTIEGNILLGPSAEYIDDPSDTQTTKKTMTALFEEAREIIPSLPDKAVINAYSGIRCKLAPPESDGWADFRIEESRHTPGLINLLGIESPGLTAAPAIAHEVTSLIGQSLELKPKKQFKSVRRNLKKFSEMTSEEQEAMIRKDAAWGRIVCRCEHVTEAEVVEALSNPLGARTFSSVKYRCRARAGRCQGGFCTQHLVRIMKDYFNMDIKEMKLKSPGSNLFYGKNRE
jgi:glycerol-3-phosphate dehydrogenase